METIIASLISAGVSLAICLITTGAQHKKTLALMEYKLDELTKKVEKHNSVIERTYKLEQTAALTAEQIKVANNRIKDLERRNEA